MDVAVALYIAMGTTLAGAALGISKVGSSTIETLDIQELRMSS